jgi:hypothetical protein
MNYYFTIYVLRDESPYVLETWWASAPILCLSPCLPASLKKKKEFPEFFKKRVPTKSSKGVPAKAYSTKIPTENTDTGCI